MRTERLREVDWETTISNNCQFILINLRFIAISTPSSKILKILYYNNPTQPNEENRKIKLCKVETSPGTECFVGASMVIIPPFLPMSSSKRMLSFALTNGGDKDKLLFVPINFTEGLQRLTIFEFNRGVLTI